MSAQPPLPTSAKVNPIDISHTDSATHVYIKTTNPQSLCPRFEGPYAITSRPSRSQVEVRVGSFANGSARKLVVHWSLCKVAHLRDGAEVASRAPLGRPKTTLQSAPDDVSNQTDAQTKPQPEPEVASDQPQPVEIAHFRPRRSTRNQNPRCIDFLALPA